MEQYEKCHNRRVHKTNFGLPSKLKQKVLRMYPLANVNR